jgi:non-heme chloroperoxidase
MTTAGDHRRGALRVASVALRNPARNGSVSLTRGQFRYGFGSAIPADEAAELYQRWSVPSPGKPLFEAAAANFLPNSPAKGRRRQPDRGPLLLIAGGNDHSVPAAVTRSTRKLSSKSPAVTDYKVFPDRGHSLTVDGGRHEVADTALAWLARHSL